LIARIKHKLGYSSTTRSLRQVRLQGSIEDHLNSTALDISLSEIKNNKVKGGHQSPNRRRSINQHPSEKIQKLEAELSVLRSEIAKIMQENGNSKVDVTGKHCSTIRDIAEDDEEDEEIKVHNSSSVPPPPPPPPLMILSNMMQHPQQLNVNNVATISMQSSSFRISGTMSSLDQPVGISNTASVGTINVEEIIQRGRTLKKSNLIRTPGGTPLRNDLKDNKAVAVTAQDMIALALKKRFKAANQKSPLKPQESDDEWNEETV